MDYQLVARMEVDALALEFSVGDLARLPFRVGALVSPDDAHLSACSSVARAIRSRANSAEVDRQVATLAGFPNAQGKLALGDVDTTAPGSAQAERIVHAVVFDARGNLREHTVTTAIERALLKADHERLVSVALPVLESMANAACQAVFRFAQQKPAFVRKVVMVARTEEAARNAASWSPSAPRPSRQPSSPDFLLSVHQKTRDNASTPPAPIVGRPANPPMSTPTTVKQASAPPTSIPAIPDPLKRAYREDRLAIFVGSGLSMSKGVEGNFPSWMALPTRLLEACATYDALSPNAIAAKQLVFQQRMSLEQMLHELGTLRAALGRDYQNALNDIFRAPKAAPGLTHDAVMRLGTRAILTTNYDQLLEMASKPDMVLRQTYTWKGAARALNDLQSGRRVLLKVHGSAEDHESVVISAHEYTQAHSDASYQAVLRYLLQDNTFLFVGYGMNDPLDLDVALRANADAFGASTRRHYVLLHEPTDADVDRLSREFNVRVIPYSDHSMVEPFLRSLPVW